MGPVVGALVLAALAGSALYAWIGIGNDPELANKPEWSALQAADVRWRSSASDEIFAISENIGGGEYDAVGIWDNTERAMVWVLTNPKQQPNIKTLPKFTRLRISHKQFEEVGSKLDVHRDVEEFLRNSIE